MKLDSVHLLNCVVNLNIHREQSIRTHNGIGSVTTRVSSDDYLKSLEGACSDGANPNLEWAIISYFRKDHMGYTIVVKNRPKFNERSFYKLSEKHKLTLLDNGTKVIAVQRLTLCRRSP